MLDRLTHIITLNAAPLAPAAPLIGTPTLGIVSPAALRKRRERARGLAGGLVLPHMVLDADMIDNLVRLRFIGEWDRDDPKAVKAKLVAALKEDLARR